MAHGHNFTAAVTPARPVWDSIPALHAFSPSGPVTIFMCSYGCGLYAVPGLKDWVDLASKMMVGGDAQAPCPNAPRSSTAASAGSGSDPSPSMVRHPRVDFQALMVPAATHPSFNPTPATLTYDERLMAQSGEAARMAASQKHLMDPVTVRDAERRILRQAFDILASGIAVTFASIVARSGAFKDHEIAASSLVKNGGTSSVKVKDLQTVMFALIVAVRGFVERVDHLVEVQHKVYKPLASGSSWLKAIHESLRGDVATLRDVIEKPGRLFSLAQYLESNSFAALGAAVTTRDASALRAFFRRELPREEAQAKKLGWKPAKQGKTEGGDDDDAAAAPSPDRSASTGAAAAGAAAASKTAAADKCKPKPKKKRRRAPSTASTATGTGTGSKS